MYEVFSYPGIDVFVVSAVGGGSHGWFGMLTEPQDPAYWRDRHPDLNPAEVEKYYGKVIADMGAIRFSQDFRFATRYGQNCPTPQAASVSLLIPSPTWP